MAEEFIKELMKVFWVLLDEGAEDGFDFVPPMFDRIEVRRVSWEKEEMAAKFLNQIFRFWRFVKGGIVHNQGGIF
ncbi:hypothetical protein Bealeia1_01782 [Candidatus Bealeia paramacronuclearis]|uniref:Uncharacterized protein n=1 Tax=Candidatus Bealeia paramacronuclearis TaxID=1921001 RepID=A0ABZ2C3W0_9PROT|nr:hypothetical protein [Candidatus Bealeia paramacronuclearis]